MAKRRAMLTFDGDPLRAQVLADYRALSTGVRNAAEINKIFDAILGNVQRTMRERMHGWNEGRFVDRLPPEILASFFFFLPFRDRVRATHVSRSWRAAALTFPHLWADISLTHMFGDPGLLRTALSRAGELPVDIYFKPPHPMSSVDEILSALDHQMHRVKSLQWHSVKTMGHCSQPAPLLEFWKSFYLDVPTDFLGGGGKLRTLELNIINLPESCPALSTVEELCLLLAIESDEEGEAEQNAATLVRLFDIFPRLQSLTMCKMLGHFAPWLPARPAPPSLSHLAIGALSNGYDLTQHYLTWRTDALREVSLHMACDTNPQLSSLFDGARELTAYIDNGLQGYGQVSITVATADGRSHNVGFADENSRVAEMVYAAHASLLRVHSAHISLEILDPFLPVLAVLPELKHLTVYVEPELNSPIEGVPPEEPAPAPSHSYAWNTLDILPRLPEYIPALDSLVLEVLCFNDMCPPNADDAVHLVEGLALLGPCTLPDVRIKGFSPAVSGATDVSRFSGLRVEFAASLE